jgi:hypothetical protein
MEANALFGSPESRRRRRRHRAQAADWPGRIAAFRSFRNYIGAEYGRWPDRAVAAPRAFTLLWRPRVRELQEGAGEVGAMVVPLEELMADAGLRERVAEHLELDLRPIADMERVAGRGDRLGSGRRERYLPFAERLVLAWQRRREREG